MFGMNKRLKYIKLVGTATASGESIATDPNSVAWSAVTFKDQSGEELHFRVLAVPKRLDEKWKLGQEGTFYILRHEKGGKYIGALYAAELDGQKFFYLDDAVKVVKGMGHMVSTRLQLLLNPATGTFVSAMVAIALYGLGGLLFSSPILGLGLAASWLVYLLYPLVQRKSYVGVDIMTDTMQAAGCEPLQATSGKY